MRKQTKADPPHRWADKKRLEVKEDEKGKRVHGYGKGFKEFTG